MRDDANQYHSSAPTLSRIARALRRPYAETYRVISEHWPLSSLRIRTPRLELRLPTPDELAALAALSAGPIHDPAVQPFANGWTDAPPAERVRRRPGSG
jgi:hypothetical protein